MGEYRRTIKTTCKFCRRGFESFALTKVCPECDANLDRYFLEIRQYLEEFAHASVSEICNDLDIPPALIKYYLKEERLEVKNNIGNHFLHCERCKKSINTGRYCFECQIIAIRDEMKTVLLHNCENDKMEKEIASFHSRKLFKR